MNRVEQLIKLLSLKKFAKQSNTETSSLLSIHSTKLDENIESIRNDIMNDHDIENISEKEICQTLKIDDIKLNRKFIKEIKSKLKNKTISAQTLIDSKYIERIIQFYSHYSGNKRIPKAFDLRFIFKLDKSIHIIVPEDTINKLIQIISNAINPRKIKPKKYRKKYIKLFKWIIYLIHN